MEKRRMRAGVYGKKKEGGRNIRSFSLIKGAEEKIALYSFYCCNYYVGKI